MSSRPTNHHDAGASKLLFILLAWSLVALLALIALATLAGVRGVYPQPRFFRDLALPAPPAPAPRDRWAPLRAGIRHLSWTGRGREAKILRRVYEERGFRPFWVSPEGLSDGGRHLVALLAGPGRERWSSEEDRLTEIGHLFQQAYPDALSSHAHAIPEFEWALSRAFLARARRLVEGRRPSARAREGWDFREQSPDVVKVLHHAEELGVRQTLSELAESHEPYTLLRQALNEYRSIERAGGWPTVPEGGPLEPGDRSSERVLALRRRLSVTGDLRTRSETEVYDGEVERAVRRFQERHGLHPDGRVGAKTLQALNVPVEERIRQLEVNLERRRWLPASLEDEFIWINIPEYRLRIFRKGQVVLQMPVVVGTVSTPTPSFQDEIDHAILNPYWNVPETIALNEIVPRAATDPGYLERGSYEVLDARGELVPSGPVRATDVQKGRYRIRRKPGPANDLGRIKFMLPNRYEVYLHDTPSRHLFERDTRAFSHGCIRLGRPMELARYLFPDRFRSGEFEQELDEGTERVVPLEKPVPVYIVYFTAWRGGDGTVQFRDDIYGRDEELWSELREDPAVESPYSTFAFDFPAHE
jgi:murein L,D-transpeptidase YcbB/YkuD